MDIVAIGRPPVLTSTSIASGPGQPTRIATVTNTWVSIVTARTPVALYSYLEKMAIFANSNANTLTFAPFINGVMVSDPFYIRYSQFGQIGAPANVRPLEIPGGSTFEIRVFDTGAGGINVETDGEINSYDRRIV